MYCGNVDMIRMKTHDSQTCGLQKCAEKICTDTGLCCTLVLEGLKQQTHSLLHLSGNTRKCKILSVRLFHVVAQ